VPLGRALTEERWSGAAKRWVGIPICRSPDGFEAYFRDIDDRKAAERSRDELTATLAAVAEALPAVAWLSAPDGRLLHLNERWFEYTGQSLGEPQDGGWMAVVHADDLEHVATATVDAMAAGGGYEVELRYRRCDGTYRWHLARAAPLQDADGRISGWVGTAKDIHHLRETQGNV
jgi:PAS domain S-box-containing protein